MAYVSVLRELRQELDGMESALDDALAAWNRLHTIETRLRYLLDFIEAAKKLLELTKAHAGELRAQARAEGEVTP